MSGLFYTLSSQSGIVSLVLSRLKLETVFKVSSTMCRKRKTSFSYFFIRSILSLTVFFWNFSAQGQVDTGATLTEIGSDSTLTYPKKMRKVMEELGERARTGNIRKYKESRNAILQGDIIGEIKRITLQANDFVKSSIDTAAIWKEHHAIDSLYDLTGDGIFSKAGIQTHRNLTISHKIITVLLDKSTERKESVDSYKKQLTNYKFQLDSLSADSVLYEFPEDSATFSEYLNTLFLTSADIAPADSAIKESIENITDLQIQLTLQVNKLSKALAIIDASRATLSANTFDRELGNIWTPIPSARPLPEIIAFSKQKNLLALNYYVKNNRSNILIGLLAILLLSIFLYTLKQRLSRENELKPGYAGQLVFRYPIVSATFIVVNLIQFLFKESPFVFSMIVWLISALCLLIMSRDFISRYLMNFLMIMIFLFLLVCIDNLILQSSRQERWWMMVLSMTGVLSGSYFLISGKRHQVKEKGIFYFIGFVVVLELAALLFNVIGRYNMSKTLLISGFMNLIIGIELVWTARLLHEIVIVASSFYGQTEKKLYTKYFEKEVYKLSAFYYIAIFIGWFILFARNFYSFKLITEPISRMLVEEHTIGNYHFAINNLLVFAFVIVLATILAQLISFFTAHKPGTIPDKNSTRSKMGSWILLLRIAIITIGLFIAAAAAGIPVDRITIVLGALSVGIGFGMQELTSSLISGIIIAFERPVNVGDIVEVAKQSGIIKSIGFRSSVITNMDGADVIIPNNTLLSSNLINWTKSDEKRRVDIEVQVVFGANLVEVKELLMELLHSDKRILQQPPPTVEFTELKNRNVQLRLYFWLVQEKDWVLTRSNVILEIDRVFKEHDIDIP